MSIRGAEGAQMSPEIIDQVAILTPQPAMLKELVADLGNIIKKVQENERETLVYYAFTVAQKNEVIVIERYANQAALDKHRAAPYFQDFLKKAPTLLAKPLELKSGNHLLLDSAKIV